MIGRAPAEIGQELLGRREAANITGFGEDRG
jgi:hypothetical protein